MTLVDILIIIGLVLFIVSRFANQGNLPIDKNLHKAKQRARTLPKVVEFPKQPEEDNGKVPGLAALKKADLTFREKDFLAGAKKAYQYYYKKWNAKDDEALAQLVSPHLLDSLISELNTLDEKNHTPAVKVKAINSVEILEARLHGQSAVIDVQFTAEQAENTLNEDGNTVGKKQPSKEVKSVWTFARALTSEDPNWSVESISKPN